jgi:2'-5' RNA ligase
MHRLFVALPVPESVAEPLIDLADGIPGLRWVDIAQLHLTLRFIGEVDGDVGEDVAAAVASIHAPAFTLRLNGVGQFHHKKSGALWAGVTPRDPVAALAAKVGRAVQSAGVPPETRAFVPHVTLARWSGPAPLVGPWIERHGRLTSPEWRVDRLVLFESHFGKAGPVYEEVLSVRLR